MTSKPVDLPADLASAYLALLSERAMLQAERDLVVAERDVVAAERDTVVAERDTVVAERDTVVAERDIAVAQAANAQAMLSDSEALIVALELAIEKLRRELRGQRSERTARLIDHMELQLEELVMAATEDELAAQAAAARTSSVRSFTRKRPVRKPWPEDAERERVVIGPPSVCACCGGSRLSKLGEDVNETFEEIPRRFKVIETVREKFTCRDCEAISQAPAPFHATPRGFVGPHLLATIVFDKFGMHSPMNRQSTRFKCEGIDLSTSTLADQVGFGTAALMPVYDLIEKHVFAAERLHGDDTTIPIQAKGKCVTGRIWSYVRDDQPFGGTDAPAAIYYASSDRRGEHPQKHLTEYGGILQTDCYNGFEPDTIAKTKKVPITFAFCHAHSRRKFFALADIQKNARDQKRKGKPISPIALEAVKRYDALFEIERQINGLSAEERLAVRQEKSKPLFDDMHKWLTEERATLSRSSEVIEPIDYMLKRWEGFALFLEDGRVCLTNNAAERALRGVALGRKNWTFAGSQRGADRAAVMLTVITTCRLNDVDPKAWLADVFARIADLPVSRLHELLPWEWKRLRQAENPASQQAA